MSIDVSAARRMAIVGIGGVGGNAINNMKAWGAPFTTIAINADAQALNNSLCNNRIQLGNTGGTLADPVPGKTLAVKQLPRLMDVVAPYSGVIFVAGLGGTIGAGVLPIFATEAAKTKKIQCVIIAPFDFEGTKRQQNAQHAEQELIAAGVPFIKLENQALLKRATDRTTLADAFAMADDAIYRLCQGIAQKGFDAAFDAPLLQVMQDCA